MNLVYNESVCYERVFYEQVCYERGLSWMGLLQMWSLMNVVCY